MSSEETLTKASALLEALEAALQRGQAPDAQALSQSLAEVSGCPPAFAAVAVGQALRDAEEIQRPRRPPVRTAWRFFRPHVEERGWLVNDSADLREEVERLNHEASQSNFADKLLSSVGLTDGGYWFKQARDKHATFSALLDSSRGLPPSRFGLLRRRGTRWQLLAEVSAGAGQITLHACHSDLVPLVEECARQIAAHCDVAILVEDLS